MIKFCELLSKKRKEKGLHKIDVAARFHWTPMYYGRYENGKLLPSKTNIGLFASFLDMSEIELIDFLEKNENHHI